MQDVGICSHQLCMVLEGHQVAPCRCSRCRRGCCCCCRCGVGRHPWPLAAWGCLRRIAAPQGCQAACCQLQGAPGRGGEAAAGRGIVAGGRADAAGGGLQASGRGRLGGAAPAALQLEVPGPRHGRRLRQQQRGGKGRCWQAGRPLERQFNRRPSPPPPQRRLQQRPGRAALDSRRIMPLSRQQRWQQLQCRRGRRGSWEREQRAASSWSCGGFSMQRQHSPSGFATVGRHGQKRAAVWIVKSRGCWAPCLLPTNVGGTQGRRMGLNSAAGGHQNGDVFARELSWRRGASGGSQWAPPPCCGFAFTLDT
jgi:hypothetical protein